MQFEHEQIKYWNEELRRVNDQLKKENAALKAEVEKLKAALQSMVDGNPERLLKLIAKEAQDAGDPSQGR